MGFKLAAVVLTLSAIACAGSSAQRQSGVLTQMSSAPCASGQDSTSQAKAAALVAVSTAGNIQSSFCQEYVVQSDRVTFRIQAKEGKRAMLLPVGGIALFRLQQDKMILRAVDLDNKDREYIVVSMIPREAAKAPETRLPKLNHLQ